VYDFRSPHRGEVIVFKAPDSWRNDPSEEDFIKRVIAVGGDHVVCCDDKQRITVNGTALDEPYIYANPDGLQDLPSEEQFDVTVPKGRLWVMGDHRSRSGDSRYNFIRGKDPNQATIAEDDVIGRAFVVFWPFGHAQWLSVPSTFDKVPDPTTR
jgi:signal peptidase I